MCNSNLFFEEYLDFGQQRKITIFVDDEEYFVEQEEYFSEREENFSEEEDGDEYLSNCDSDDYDAEDQLAKRVQFAEDDEGEQAKKERKLLLLAKQQLLRFFANPESRVEEFRCSASGNEAYRALSLFGDVVDMVAYLTP